MADFAMVFSVTAAIEVLLVVMGSPTFNFAVLSTADLLSALFFMVALAAFHRPQKPHNAGYMGLPPNLECVNTGWLEPVCTMRRPANW
jgi:hypothetical protein